MADNGNQSFLVDGIKSSAIHNDVARIQFMQLDMNGKPDENVCLLIPVKQAGQVVEALKQLATRK